MVSSFIIYGKSDRKPSFFVRIFYYFFSLFHPKISPNKWYLTVTVSPKFDKRLNSIFQNLNWYSINIFTVWRDMQIILFFARKITSFKKLNWKQFIKKIKKKVQLTGFSVSASENSFMISIILILWPNIKKFVFFFFFFLLFYGCFFLGTIFFFFIFLKLKN